MRRRSSSSTVCTPMPYGGRATGMPGSLRTEPGFNLTIADAASGSELARQIGDWLRQNEAILQALARVCGYCELDVGLGAEGPEEFDVGVRLDPSDLSILARSRTALVFTAYPRSS